MQNVRPALQIILDTITEGPEFMRNGRLDIFGSNQLGRDDGSERSDDDVICDGLGSTAPGATRE